MATKEAPPVTNWRFLPLQGWAWTTATGGARKRVTTFRADVFTQAHPPKPGSQVLMVGSSQSTHKPSGARGQQGWGPRHAGQNRWRALCPKGVGTGQT